MTETSPLPQARLRLRIRFDHGPMLGPGKVELLEAIRDTGSISAAGRGMNMSYKRAWMLVEEMNAAFRAPLVDSARGGPGGGGARLTEAGEEVLACYHAILTAARQGAAAEIEALRGMLRDIPDGK